MGIFPAHTAPERVTEIMKQCATQMAGVVKAAGYSRGEIFPGR